MSPQCNVYNSGQRRKLLAFKGFSRKVVVVVPPEEEWRRRLALRRQAEGEDVPDSVMLEMKGDGRRGTGTGLRPQGPVRGLAGQLRDPPAPAQLPLAPGAGDGHKPRERGKTCHREEPGNGGGGWGRTPGRSRREDSGAKPPRREIRAPEFRVWSQSGD